MWRTCRLARPDLCQAMCQAQEVMVGNMGICGGVGGRRDFLVALLFAQSRSLGH